MKYMILDQETENHYKFRRLANQFIPENYVVMRGWKVQGDARCSMEYFADKSSVTPMNIPDDVTLLVGHNIKFDLLYEWHTEELKAFFKRGGQVWCTQYAEYLIEAQKQSVQMNSLDSIVEQYGGRVKIDEVKVLWNAGVLTSDIDKDLLEDYLIGTEEENRDSGDIGNTELVFLGQIKKAMTKYPINMVPMIQARMDGLCCTMEMEYNGLKIDVVEAGRKTKILTEELGKLDVLLEEYIPELSDGMTFNWNSGIQVSCLIFGGTVKYKKSANYLDEKTGELARLKAKEKWPLFGGRPIDFRLCVDHMKEPYKEQPDYWEDELFYFVDGEVTYPDCFKSGRKKGEIKTKNVDVQGKLKTKIQDFFFEMEGYTDSKPEWEGKQTDGANNPVYFTNSDVIGELGVRDIPFLTNMSLRQDVVKDLGTYYVRYDVKKKQHVGMLTCVQPWDHIVHHSLNHTNTVTTRLSSSDPNMQNIPKASTSDVKKMFISRFKNGSMLEADYSQLEVVVQGLLTGDKNLIKDLNNNMDFHCKRVALKNGITYNEAVEWCKNEDNPDYAAGKDERNKCKIFSFQRAYGAGAVLISASSGMSVEEVQTLIEAEEIEYAGVVDFNDAVEKAARETAVPFNDPTRDFRTFRRGYWQAPTGTVYSWRSYDAPEWQKAKGTNDNFMPTEIKNYPTQGTGGEIVQIIIGRLWRHFVANGNYSGKALLCNTVHDCVWFDCADNMYRQISNDIKPIMESVPEVLKELYDLDCPVKFPVDVEYGPNMWDMKHVS